MKSWQAMSDHLARGPCESKGVAAATRGKSRGGTGLLVETEGRPANVGELSSSVELVRNEGEGYDKKEESERRPADVGELLVSAVELAGEGYNMGLGYNKEKRYSNKGLRYNKGMEQFNGSPAASQSAEAGVAAARPAPCLFQEGEEGERERQSGEAQR
jgi:hypothetical protein